ncbi:MAG: type II toxin-antitoxin system RelB/DinJ family antitoxin [Ignavibacteriota bacterium]
MSTTMVHVRVDEKTKRRAAKTLAGMGISVSDAVRMLLVRVAAEKALPFDVKVPERHHREGYARGRSGHRQAAEVRGRAIRGPGHLSRCGIRYEAPSSGAT